MSEEVRNAAERLRKLLRAAQYPQLSALRLESGDVSDLLRVLHFVLLDSSRPVAQFLVTKGYDLFGKTDARFVESAFRLLRDEFRCFPSLSVTQFLSRQFVAKKLAIVADAAAAVAHKRQELQRLKRSQEVVWSQPQEGVRRRENKPQVENHVLPRTTANHAASILQHLKVPTERRRASSVTLVQVKAVEQDRESPSSTGRQIDGRVHWDERSASEEGLTEDDAVQTEDVPKSYHDSDNLMKAIGDLSRQLSEMSGALMRKISSVENRVGRLEDQMHEVQVAVDEQRDFARKSNSVHISRTTDVTDDDALPRQANPTDRRRDLSAEPPCAWPPQPSVFERY